jgi:DNA-binding NtrC family response regulator
MAGKRGGEFHPVVAAFVGSDQSLLKILTDAPEPRGPMVDAMLLMREALEGKRPAEEALKVVRAVPQRGADPNLTIIFLGMWSTLAPRTPGGSEESAALGRRAKSLLGRDTPPQIRTIPLYQESLQLLARGDRHGAEKALLESMRGLNVGAPRHKSVLLNLGFFLAEQGRGEELEPRLEAVLREAPEQYSSRVALIRYANRVATGRQDDLERLRAEVAGDSLLRTINAGLIAMYDQWLTLMRERASSPGPEDPPAAEVVRRLLTRRVDEALELARRQAQEAPELSFTQVGLFAFNLVRAELAAGHGEAARRIVELRGERGNDDYLDDLFLARAELLAGDRGAAARHFARVAGACRRYRAEGRLDFELRMSCELSPGDLMGLVRTSQDLPAPAPAPDRAPAPEAAGEPRGVRRLLGSSAAIQRLRAQVLQFAAVDASVLIAGETGTGKELVARALHESGPRAAEPFVAVNCGAITESLLESELFGHLRGAFTGAEKAHRGLFEEAGRGTILLDEVGELSPRLQVALLRVLETSEVRPVGSASARKVACRVLAATNADLPQLTGRGVFRPDLLYRLRRLEIHIPPLRERCEDILDLADAFLSEGRRDGRRPVMSDELRKRLVERPWPGNVRELRNEIERMRLIHSDKLEYGPDDLQARMAAGAEADAAAPPAGGGASTAGASDQGDQSALPAIPGLADGRSTLRRRDRIREMFLRHRRLNGAELARALGVSPKTICRDLGALTSEGLVGKVMPTASPRTHYFELRTPPAGQ